MNQSVDLIVDSDTMSEKCNVHNNQNPVVKLAQINFYTNSYGNKMNQTT